jgi:hypothetical protein
LGGKEDMSGEKRKYGSPDIHIGTMHDLAKYPADNHADILGI